MWSECKSCGTPVVLTSAKTGEIVEAAGVKPEEIDEDCMILLSHCPACANMAKKGAADATVVKMRKAMLSQPPVSGPKS